VLNPEDHATIHLYTGDATTARDITGVGFDPDFAWFKDRDISINHYVFDVIRGATKSINTNDSAAEATISETLQAFIPDGVTIGNHAGVNRNGNNFWSFMAQMGGAEVINNDGTIQSLVSANVPAGCSVTLYNGTGAVATVGHGLTRKPDMMIVKQLNTTQSWRVYHRDMFSSPATRLMFLDVDNGRLSDSTLWNDTEPNNSVITLGSGSGANQNGGDYVIYCFAFGDVFAGGGYTGNGNADGVFVPDDEILMPLIKRASSVGAWVIEDTERNPFNPADLFIAANLTAAESTAITQDINANGLKMRSTGTFVNGNNDDYIYFGIKKKALAFT